MIIERAVNTFVGIHSSFSETAKNCVNKQHITVDNSYTLLYTVYQEEEEPDETDN